MQNLEIKKLTSDKKDALAAQFAAEAALRRLHANQKDDDALPLASVVAPLEAEIKMYKNEVVDESYKKNLLFFFCEKKRKVRCIILLFGVFFFSDCCSSGR